MTTNSTLTPTDVLRVVPIPDRRRRSTAARLVLGIPYWVFTTALAVIFLYPLIWTTITSVQPRAGTSQTEGWGFGNYIALANYQAGIWV